MVKSLGILTLSLLLLLFPVSEARAELNAQTSSHFEAAFDVRLKLKLHDTLLRTQTKLELKLGHLENLKLSESEFQQRWSSEFKTITQDYLQEQMENYQLDTNQINAIKSKLAKLNWTEFSSFFLLKVKSLKAFVRHVGAGMFMAVVLTNILQAIFPIILSVLGMNPMIGIIMLNIPTTLPVIYAYQLVGNSLYRIKLTEAVGGKEAYLKLKELQKDVLKNLDIAHIHDHILPLDFSGDTIVIPKQSLLTQVAQFFGLKKDRLTLKTLKKFMTEQKIDDQLAWGLVNSPKLSQQDKIALLMTHFHESLELDKRAALRLSFSANFTELNLHTQNWNSTSEWVKQTLNSKSEHDIFFHLERMPDELSPQELSAIWEEILLPEFSKSEQLSYVQMRKAVVKFHAYKLEVETIDHRTMTTELRQKFLQYLGSAMQSKAKGCFNTHQQVIESLLKSL